MVLQFVICFFVFGVSLFTVVDAYSRCDETIEKNIRKQWGTDIPKNLISQAKGNVKELVIMTTPKYYPADIKCVYSVFSDNQFTLTKIPKNGSSVSTTFTIKEDGGTTVTESQDGTTVRYHVFQKDGVTAVYTCNTKGADSDKNPDGFIKVKAGNVDQATVGEAKEALRKVGVTVSQPLCQRELQACSGEDGK